MAEDFQLAIEIQISCMLASIIPVLIKEKIPDKLLESPRSIPELVEGTNINGDRLHRFLQMLEIKNLAKFDTETKLWHPTEKTVTITGQTANVIWPWLFSRCVQESNFSLGNILYSEKTCFEYEGRKPFFENLKETPDLLILFQNAMKTFTKSNAEIIEKSLDLEETTKILDVGGGDGTLIIGLAKKYPEKKYGVYEIPEIAQMASRNIESEGLSQSIDSISGNMFESIPQGFDCILMKHIVCDWNDEKIRILLSNCRKALVPGNKLYIIDSALERNHPIYNLQVFKDVHMMTLLGAKLRTLEELTALLNETGFRFEKILVQGFDDVLQATAI